MDKRKLAKRKQEKALDFWAQMGIAINPAEIVHTSPETLDKAPQYRELQGEAALLFLAKPERFISKKCDWCDEYFAATYRSVSFCSNTCRAKAFEKQTGMKVDWGAKTDIERWGGEPPLILDPNTFKFIADYVMRLKNQNSIPDLESLKEKVEVPTQTSQAPVTNPQQMPFSGSPELILPEVDFADLL